MITISRWSTGIWPFLIGEFSDEAAHQRPGLRKSRMQWQGGDFDGRNPADVVGFVVVHQRDRAQESGDDGRVAPTPVVVDRLTHRLDIRCRQADFFACFPECGRRRRLVGIPGTAGHTPGAAVVGVRRPKLQQHIGIANDEKSGGTEQTPVPMPSCAAGPAVPRTHRQSDPISFITTAVARPRFTIIHATGPGERPRVPASEDVGVGG